MFTILINILFPYLTLDGRVGGEAQSSPADPILCDLHSHTITHYHIRRGWVTVLSAAVVILVCCVSQLAS